MLMNSPDYSTCLFSWYGLLIMVGGVGGVGGDQSDPRMPDAANLTKSSEACTDSCCDVTASTEDMDTH